MFLQTKFGNELYFYVFAARQAAAVFSYQFVKYSLHDELNTPSRMKIMTLSLTCVVTCILEIILVCAVYALMKRKNTVCQHNYFWSRSDGLLCSIYFQAATAQNGYECSDSRFYLDYNYYHKSAVLGFQCQYSRLQELYAEKQQIQQELENTEYFYEKYSRDRIQSGISGMI